jgi:hypothetical protein
LAGMGGQVLRNTTSLIYLISDCLPSNLFRQAKEVWILVF